MSLGAGRSLSIRNKKGETMGRKSGDMDYAMELKADYQKWFTIWKQGWSDPNYPDGTGLNGARGRIMREKKELEKTDGELPEEYHWLLPPEVPEDFMARTKERNPKLPAVSGG